MSERWPVPAARPMRLSLGPDGTMSAGDGSSGTRGFTYDPRNPVPTYGGRNMAIDVGPLDQRPAEAHPDYGLTYLGWPLEVPMTLAGPVSVAVHISSDCPDTDVVVKLVEVSPDGRAALLMDGVVRAMYRDGVAEPRQSRELPLKRIAQGIGRARPPRRIGRPSASAGISDGV